MDSTLFVGLSHQMAMRRNMDILANNIANMNTTAFKKENVVFQEYLVRMEKTDTPAARNVSYVHDTALIRDFSEGAFRSTGNPLDFALSGKSFFRVGLPDGTEAYTRNGHFRVSENGEIVTSSGYPVLDDGGEPIIIDPEDGSIDVSSDGTISTPLRGVIGRLGVVEFEDLSALEKAGESLYATEAVPVPAEGFTLLQGMYEGSNVEPIVEMTNMMNFAKRYQSVAKLLNDLQELQGKAANRLAKINS
ncbi:MAG: flagellar basal-body rod protein FlgF [Sphingomonadales bacterium]